jgi:hypothetical protein
MSKDFAVHSTFRLKTLAFGVYLALFSQNSLAQEVTGYQPAPRPSFDVLLKLAALNSAGEANTSTMTAQFNTLLPENSAKVAFLNNWLDALTDVSRETTRLTQLKSDSFFDRAVVTSMLNQIKQVSDLDFEGTSITMLTSDARFVKLARTPLIGHVPMNYATAILSDTEWKAFVQKYKTALEESHQELKSTQKILESDMNFNISFLARAGAFIFDYEIWSTHAKLTDSELHVIQSRRLDIFELLMQSSFLTQEQKNIAAERLIAVFNDANAGNVEDQKIKRTNYANDDSILMRLRNLTQYLTNNARGEATKDRFIQAVGIGPAKTCEEFF